MSCGSASKANLSERMGTMTTELIGIIAAAIALGALTSTLAGFVFVSLNRMESRLNNRIDGVETRLNSRMEEQKADLVKQMDEQKTDLTMHINGVETRLSNRMDEQKADLIKQMDGLKYDHGRRLDSIDSRLQSVEQSQSEVKGSVETLQRVVIATLQREIEAEREPVGAE